VRSHVTNSLLNSVFFTAAVTVMHFLMALLPSACTAAFGCKEPSEDGQAIVYRVNECIAPRALALVI
jgi:hypothetical protein